MGLDSLNFLKGEPKWVKGLIDEVKAERPDAQVTFKGIREGKLYVKINGSGDYGIGSEGDAEANKNALLFFIDGAPENV